MSDPLRSVLILLIAAPGAGVALAQEPSPRFEISLVAAYWNGDQTGTYAFIGGPQTLREAGGPAYGLRLGYNASGLLELEAEASRVNSAQVVRYQNFDSRKDEHISYLLAFATVHLARGRIRPYLTIGAGAREDPQFSWRFTAAGGGGVKLLINPHVGVRLDARVLATSLPNFKGNALCIDCGAANRDWTFDGEFGGGLVFAF